MPTEEQGRGARIAGTAESFVERPAAPGPPETLPGPQQGVKCCMRAIQGTGKVDSGARGPKGFCLPLAFWGELGYKG